MLFLVEYYIRLNSLRFSVKYKMSTDYLNPLGWQLSKKQKVASVVEVTEKSEPLSIVGGNIK